MRREDLVPRTLIAAALLSGMTWSLSAQSDKLVYADFENAADGRAVSARGGAVTLFGYSENPTRQPVFSGKAGVTPPVPDLVRTKPDDPNHLAKFDFELVTPNQSSGVTLEIKGQADRTARRRPKTSRLQDPVASRCSRPASTTCASSCSAAGWRMNPNDANPRSPSSREGLDTYKVELKKFAQPAWVTETRIDPKDVLKS